MRRIAAAGLAAALAVPSLTLAWGPAEAVSRADRISLDPKVVVDAQGAATYVWTEATGGTTNRIVARHRFADGHYAPSHYLTPGGSTSQDVRAAVSDAGTVTLAWLRIVGGVGAVEFARMTPGGVISINRFASSTARGTEAFDLDVSPAGEVVFAFKYSIGTQSRLFMRRLSSAGSLRNVVAVSPPTVPDVGEFDTSIAANGDVAVLWTDAFGDGPPASSLHYRVLPLVGAAGVATDVGKPPAAPLRPQVETMANGNLVFSWLNSRTAYAGAQYPSTSEIEVCARHPDGSVGAIRQLTIDPFNEPVPMFADRQNHAFFKHTGDRPPLEYLLYTDADGVAVGGDTLAPIGDTVPAMGVDAAGTVLVGSIYPGNLPTARSRTLDGNFGVDGSFDATQNDSMDIGGGAGGQAAFAWVSGNAAQTTGQIFTSIGP